jgi:hypothetical protein
VKDHAGTGAPLAVAAGLVVLLMACGGSSGPTDPDPGPTPTPPPPSGGAFDYNGITHVSWWHDQYGSAEGSASRQALAATGGNWAGLLTTWYMDRRDSSTMGPHSTRTPAEEGVRRAITEMHGLGLKVMLKPHVDVLDGTWRGQIAPADRGAWFASYAEMMDHFAVLANETGVEMLCIGTELATMSDSRHAPEWATLVDRVRARYSGLLTYAANANHPADELTSVSFWPRLDLLGLDVYTPLTNRTSPTHQELVDAWRRNRDGHDMVAAYRNLQAAHGKPLIFTEIGYRSADGTNRAPWDWQASMGPDPAEQADCYRAAYEVWSGETAWMRGLFWWSWDVPAPGAGDTGYSPWGKPAEAVLRAGQGG